MRYSIKALLLLASLVGIVDTTGNVKAVVNRYQPKTNPFFIVGHCWFAFAMSLLALSFGQAQTDSGSTHLQCVDSDCFASTLFLQNFFQFYRHKHLAN